MPTVSLDGEIVTLKVLPHYLEDIRSGRKKADVRRLDARWLNIFEYADKVKFVSTESDSFAEYFLEDLTELGGVEVEIIQRLYADVRWGSGYGDFYLIKFYTSVAL